MEWTTGPDRKPPTLRRSRSTADAGRTPASGRVAAVLAAAAVLVLAPGIAQAAFTGTATGSTSVGTMSMPAPTGASVVAVCPSGRKLSITVVSYGYVPRATGYDFTVTDPSGNNVPTSGASYSQHPAAAGTWTYQIHGLYTVSASNVWIGQPFTGTVVC
ncbi:hypothetical protein [Arthrobacter sp. efr-133-R2A-63]|uniref:hypothetical protein n=1 Tax=Arthrobacter sp. efr-133-R2A-63 TaxID=3040278 RepID=UPI00254C0188|nr:hypothetical protein [Arthrobacter sp. efr-133-R2A-63]